MENWVLPQKHSQRSQRHGTPFNACSVQHQLSLSDSSLRARTEILFLGQVSVSVPASAFPFNCFFLLFDINLFLPSPALHVLYLFTSSACCWLWCFTAPAHCLCGPSLHAWSTLYSTDLVGLSFRLPKRESIQGC